jgi:hypothetical protein
VSKWAKISIADTSHLVMPGSTKVRLTDFVTVYEGDSVAARMDAYFDFAEISPAYHQTVLNLLLSKRTRLVVPVKERLPAVTPSSPATAIAHTRQPRKWWQFWRRA